MGRRAAGRRGGGGWVGLYVAAGVSLMLGQIGTCIINFELTRGVVNTKGYGSGSNSSLMTVHN